MGVFVPHIDSFNSAAESKQMQLAEETAWIINAQKDLTQFEPLYKRYYRPIFEYVYRRCDDHDASVDVTSVVFEKAMINLHKFKLQGYPFGSWLYRIAASEIGNYYRNKKKERKVWVQTDGIRDIAQEFESKLADEDNLQILLRAMEHLKTEDMELVVMRFFEKRSMTEISGILDTTESNARVKLHRVIGRLRAAFEKEREKEK